MIQNKLTIKAFYQGKEIKIIPLKNISYFFDGLDTLGRKWKVKPFTYLLDFTNEIKCHPECREEGFVRYLESTSRPGPSSKDHGSSSS